MMKLSQEIRDFLKTFNQRVYQQIAPQNVVYPYLVYDFQLYPDGEGGELCTLSVDAWDKTLTGDTSIVENLIALVNGIIDVNGNPTGLNKKTIINEEFAITFYNDNMLGILDDDVTLRHRNYNYNGNLRRI